MSFTESVAANVRAEVARKGKTQTELAFGIGMSKQSVSAKMNADSAFTLNDLERIANWLGIDIQILFQPVRSGLIAA